MLPKLSRSTSNLNQPKYKILGKGGFGIVIKPPIIPNKTSPVSEEEMMSPAVRHPNDLMRCDTFYKNINENDYVGKIAFNPKELKNEYKFINKLLEIDTAFSSLVKDKIILCPLFKEDIPKNPKSLLKEIEGYVEEFPSCQLIMPYLGETFCEFLDTYKKLCKRPCKVDIDTTDVVVPQRIVDIVTCKRVIVAFQKLYDDIKSYNTSGIFHNDIKPDNLIYNVENNVLIMIDFNNSIHKQIINTYVHNIKSYQELIDKYDFMNKVVLYFLEIAFNNQTIYDELYDLYEKLVKYKNSLTIKMKPQYELHKKDFMKIKKNIDSEMANLFERVLNMNKNALDVERTDSDFCSLIHKNFQSVEEQRKNAVRYNEYKKNITRENKMMGYEDKRGGKKTRKIRKK
jgi:serine/threonine protein kinase